MQKTEYYAAATGKNRKTEKENFSIVSCYLNKAAFTENV